MSNAIMEMSTRTSVRSMSLLTATGYTVGEYIKGMSRTIHGDEIAPGLIPGEKPQTKMKVRERT